MLAWALQELEARRQALDRAQAEVAELRTAAESASASWQEEDAAHQAMAQANQAEIRRLEMVNKELRLQYRMDREARIAHDAQIAALCTLFAKIASDLAEAKSLLSKIAKREH